MRIKKFKSSITVEILTDLINSLENQTNEMNSMHQKWNISWSALISQTAKSYKIFTKHINNLKFSITEDTGTAHKSHSTGPTLTALTASSNCRMLQNLSSNSTTAFRFCSSIRIPLTSAWNSKTLCDSFCSRSRVPCSCCHLDTISEDKKTQAHSLPKHSRY